MSVDAVTRLRLMAAGLHTTLYAEEHLELPYDKVWAVASDLAGELPHLVPALREFRVQPGDADRKRALAVGPLGCRSAFDVRLAPGWCLMQSRLVVGGMAAVPEGDGTRFAMLGAAGTRGGSSGCLVSQPRSDAVARETIKDKPGDRMRNS